MVRSSARPPARPHQRRARHLEDRGRAAHALPRPSTSATSLTAGRPSAASRWPRRKGSRSSLRSPRCRARSTSDRRRVEQIVLNLLSNAVKFTDTGRRARRCACPGRRSRHRVADTGIGIKAEDLEQALSAVPAGRHRDDAVSTRGRASGLSICQRLVELLGGSIGVDERSGMGEHLFGLPSRSGGRRHETKILYHRGQRAEPLPRELHPRGPGSRCSGRTTARRESRRRRRAGPT